MAHQQQHIPYIFKVHTEFCVWGSRGWGKGEGREVGVKATRRGHGLRLQLHLLDLAFLGPKSRVVPGFQERLCARYGQHLLSDLGEHVFVTFFFKKDFKKF